MGDHVTDSEWILHEALEEATVGDMLYISWLLEIPRGSSRPRGHVYLKQSDGRWLFHSSQSMGRAVAPKELSVAYSEDFWVVM